VGDETVAGGQFGHVGDETVAGGQFGHVGDETGRGVAIAPHPNVVARHLAAEYRAAAMPASTDRAVALASAQSPTAIRTSTFPAKDGQFHASLGKLTKGLGSGKARLFVTATDPSGNVARAKLVAKR
jgi:hypothetical protein